MELRHLRYFVTVAEELNVRRAAQHLHISQPPLSRQIHDLEDELGVKLFDRRKQKLTLTKAGEAFSKEAKQILSHAQRAAQLAKAASRGEAGQLPAQFIEGFILGVLFPLNNALVTGRWMGAVIIRWVRRTMSL